MKLKLTSTQLIRLWAHNVELYDALMAFKHVNTGYETFWLNVDDSLAYTVTRAVKAIGDADKPKLRDSR